MPISFTPEQIHAEAQRLGLIGNGEHDCVRQDQRNAVVASLVARARRKPAEPPGGASVPQLAQRIDIHPGGGPIDIDGRPLPWQVAADQLTVTLNPDGSGTVRLTIPAAAIRIHPSPDEDNRA
jgi:hypothetical protein